MGKEEGGGRRQETEGISQWVLLLSAWTSESDFPSEMSKEQGCGVDRYSPRPWLPPSMCLTILHPHSPLRGTEDGSLEILRVKYHQTKE
jgi:hypothetical protein